MSHYGVNSSIPKTRIQYLVRWVVDNEDFSGAAHDVLMGIPGTEISPELVTSDGDAEAGPHQRSEDFVGLYELQDFLLYYVLCFGYRLSKVAFLARHAWADRTEADGPTPSMSRRQ